ncbi:MAG: glycosyltransferase family 2 protein [Bacteroidota bacterium]|nr:glycosyltransferase family 2 protein [Bacteroidota bacterium]
MTISIITASYNSEQTIETAIQSVLSQTYKNIEYIVVDGNSNDGTYEKILKYRDDIHTVIHEPDDGIYDALNKGIEAATGDFVGFLHADDVFASPSVTAQIAELINVRKADAVYGDLQYVKKENTAKVIRFWKSGEFSFRKLYYGWMPPHPTFFLRRAIYLKYGVYDKSYRIAADYELILRILGKHKIIPAYLPIVVTKMRVGGASNRSLKNIVQKSREDFRALRTNKFGSAFTLIFKNLRKLGQFVNK